jgi:hypothetical protein
MWKSVTGENLRGGTDDEDCLSESSPDNSGLEPIIHFYFFLAVHEVGKFGSSYLSYDPKAISMALYFRANI